MKIKNFKLKINCRGEIATLLTVVTLGLMLVGTVVGTKLAGQGPREQSEARGFGELKTNGTLDNCKWDTAGELCKDSGDKGRCICEKLGTGICTPVGGSCEKNPWDSTWGCWSVSQCKDPGAPPPPAEGGGQLDGGQQQGGQQAASCTLAAQDPNYGNCCGSCLASKRPDLRPFFNNNGWSACNDSQIVNNWCNGISDVATNDCKKIRESDCKTECSKDQSTCQATGGTTSGTAGSPTPTVPPPPASSGGSTDGGTETPGEPKTGGYLIVEGRNLILNRVVTPPNSSIDIESENEAELPTILVNGSNYISVASPTTRATSPITYQYPLSGKIVKKLDFASPNLFTAKAVFGTSNWDGASQSHYFTPNSDSSSEITLENLKVCFPKFSDSEKTQADANTLPASTIISKCSGRINTLDQEATLPEPEEPSPSPDYSEEFEPSLKVIVSMSNSNMVTQHTVKLNTPPKLRISEQGSNQDIDFDNNPWPPDYNVRGGAYNPGAFSSLSKIKKYSKYPRSSQLFIHGFVYDEKGKQTRVYCDFNKTTTIAKDEPFTKDSYGNLGSITFKILYTGDIPTSCGVEPGSNGGDKIIIGQSLFGSSNEIFRKAMERWVAGEIGVLEMSGFVNQLTRYPGLQISFCDPRKGECNPTF